MSTKRSESGRHPAVPAIWGTSGSRRCNGFRSFPHRRDPHARRWAHSQTRADADFADYPLRAVGGDSATVVASAALNSLVTDASAGTARVEDWADGVRVLVVNTDYQAAPDGDLEVWLIDPNVEGMVAVS